MEKYILLWLAGINLLALVLCGIDKWKAQRGRWRIPEKTLFGLALIGGSIGGVCFDQIDDRFRLGQIQLAVEESPLGELTTLGR